MSTLSPGPARNFTLDEFEGPLDLLLFLIKKNEVNIFDIPIARITEQFLTYLAYAVKLDLDDVTGFYAEASNLLYIKSRMLLPAELALDDDEEDPRQELVERLIEYQKIKKYSELLEEKENETEWVIERKKLQRTLPFVDDDLWQEMDIRDLLNSFSRLMPNLSVERIIDLYEEISVNEKIALLTELLENRGECSFFDLVGRKDSIMSKICAFLAILESVKLKMIVVFQNRMFGDIVLRPREQAPIEKMEKPENQEVGEAVLG